MHTKKKTFILIAIIAAVLALASVAGVFGLPYIKSLSGGETEPPSTSPDMTTTPAPTASAGNVPTTSAPAGTTYQADGLVWNVRPELEHETLYYCGVCRQYGLEHNNNTIIDKKTGLLIGGDEGFSGHGVGSGVLLYDEEHKLYGIHLSDLGDEELEMLTPEKFTEKYLQKTSLRAFRKINSEKIKKNIPDNPDQGFISYDLSKAYTGKFAAAYGTIFISDFIYDYNVNKHGLNSRDLIALGKDSKWGVLYKDGKTALPFIFEDILLIYEDENDDFARTAFAKYKGKYGIIDIAKTAALNGVTIEAVTRKIPDKPGEYRVATKDDLPLRLREGPGTNYEFVVNIPNKTELTITEISGSWGKTTYNKKTGWVSLDFLDYLHQ